MHTLALFVRLRSARVDASSCKRPKTLYGAFFVKGVRGGSYPFFFPQSFFVRPGKPFLRPDPQSRRAGTRRSGQGWRVAPPRKGLVLEGFEHDGTLVVVGMTKSEGSPHVVARTFVPHPCIRWVKTQTMMQ